MEIIGLLRNIIENKLLINIVLSGARSNIIESKRINIRPIVIKDEYLLQFESNINNKSLHSNVSIDYSINKIYLLIKNEYKNFNIITIENEYTGVVSKKGQITFKKKDTTTQIIDLKHNKKKEYLIPDNEKCDFLIKLGVMDNEGKVFKKKYDKFKQINKFLEIIDSTINQDEIGDDFRIIDFGCGKAYLTFAVYHYFVNILNKSIDIIGLDLKEDVIEFCNNVSLELGFNNLKFFKGDITDFITEKSVNMVITLHACDNATDAALVKAIKWNSEYILSVPCCQHEFFNKINNLQVMPMLEYGLIKERISSLATDTLRILFLNTKGYEVKIIEFVAMEHTPKNLMIKAIKKDINIESANIKYKNFKSFWGLNDIYIEKFYNEE